MGDADAVVATNMSPTTIVTTKTITTAATTATTIRPTTVTNIAATKTSTTIITTITATTTNATTATLTPGHAVTHADADATHADADAVVLESERSREELSQKLKSGTHSGTTLTVLLLVWRVNVTPIN